MNSPDNAGNKWLIVFYPPPCPDMNPFCLELGVRKKCFPFMGFLKPLPICLASVGSRSVGFLPSPTVRLDFRFQLVSVLFGTCFDSKVFRKKSWLAFLPSIWSPIVSNFSNTLNIDLVIPAHCTHMEFHSVCVCVYWGQRERVGHVQALDMTHYQYVSPWILFRTEWVG